jgi:hypothetical protein
LFALRSRNTPRPGPMEVGGNMGGIGCNVQFVLSETVDNPQNARCRFVPHQGGLSQR